jgi:excinuclease ABC subunit C
MTKLVRQATNELNLHFRLRDCPRDTPLRFLEEPVESNAVEFLPCLRADLGTCLAPCAGGCTKTDYRGEIEKAAAFLDGNPQTDLQLQQDMQRAAQERNYEKAARLRDRLGAFQKLDSYLRRFHDWNSRASFLYSIRSAFDDCEWWLTIIRGVIIDATICSARAEDRQKVVAEFAARIRQLGEPRVAAEITGPDEFESSRILFRWFRRRPEEQKHCRSLAKGGRLCHSIPTVFNKRVS